MRRFLTVILLLVIIPMTYAQTAQGTTLDTVNLRSGAGKSFAVITQIPYQTVITLQGRNATSSWLLATYNGTQGWVSAKYVRLDTVTMADLAVADTLINTPSVNTTQPQTPTGGFTRIVVGESGYPITAPPVNLTNWALSITLHWNSTANLDIAVTEPKGFVLTPGSGTTPNGGSLNLPNGVNNDCNDRDGAALEVANWDLGKAPKGTYTITVTYSNHCFPEQEEKTLFWVSVKDNGPQTEFWVYYIEPNTIYEFTYTVK